jgi:hypothetical protein
MSRNPGSETPVGFKRTLMVGDSSWPADSSPAALTAGANSESWPSKEGNHSTHGSAASKGKKRQPSPEKRKAEERLPSSAKEGSTGGYRSPRKARKKNRETRTESEEVKRSPSPDQGQSKERSPSHDKETKTQRALSHDEKEKRERLPNSAKADKMNRQTSTRSLSSEQREKNDRSFLIISSFFLVLFGVLFTLYAMTDSVLSSFFFSILFFSLFLLSSLLGALFARQTPKLSQFQKNYPSAVTLITVFRYQDGKQGEIIEAIKAHSRNTIGLLSLTAMEIGERKVQSVAVYESIDLEGNARLMKTCEQFSELVLAGSTDQITAGVHTAGGVKEFVTGASSQAVATMTTLKLKQQGVAPPLELYDTMPNELKKWPGYIGMSAVQVDETTFRICVIYESMEKMQENRQKAREVMNRFENYVASSEGAVGVVGYAFSKKF